jgi:hypothetical protein
MPRPGVMPRITRSGHQRQGVAAAPLRFWCSRFLGFSTFLCTHKGRARARIPRRTRPCPRETRNVVSRDVVWRARSVQAVPILVASKSQPRSASACRPARRLVAAGRAPKEHAAPVDLQQRIVALQAAHGGVDRSRGPLPKTAHQGHCRCRGYGLRCNVLEIGRHDGHPLPCSPYE